MNKFHHLAGLATALIVLTGCGGGGGGGTTASTTATPTSFLGITVPTSFDWKTQKSTSSGQLILNNVHCGSSCLQFRVTLSNFILVDPTGDGLTTVPMSTDVLATALTTGSATSATVNFGKLTFPAGQAEVLVEVFDVATGGKLDGAKATVANLVAGSVTLTF